MAQYYFLDALCIDQDNLPEKSLQVGIMGKIFSRARLVMACIGPPDESVAAFMDMVQAHTPVDSTFQTERGRWTNAISRDLETESYAQFPSAVEAAPNEPYFGRA